MSDVLPGIDFSVGVISVPRLIWHHFVIPKSFIGISDSRNSERIEKNYIKL